MKVFAVADVWNLSEDIETHFEQETSFSCFDLKALAILTFDFVTGLNGSNKRVICLTVDLDL